MSRSYQRAFFQVDYSVDILEHISRYKSSSKDPAIGENKSCVISSWQVADTEGRCIYIWAS